jgi:hypothetical protein
MESFFLKLLEMASAVNLNTWLLIITVMVLLVVVIRWHLDPRTRFDLRDMMVSSQSKEVSVYKVGQLIALLVSTWVIVYETREKRLTEWLFTAYMIAWGGVNMAQKWIDRDAKPAPPATDPTDSKSV